MYSVCISFFTLPENVRYDFANWNSVAWANIPIAFFWFLTRMAWFAGIGRTRYYFGQAMSQKKEL